jgi:hypothetical protein
VLRKIAEVEHARQQKDIKRDRGMIRAVVRLVFWFFVLSWLFLAMIGFLMQLTGHVTH